ncbi:MAG TPA: RdgB/HAM1 family non-canonical purine NTP pyrophosphatase [Blastocatellia bacterium]|nr:RdgB/HAM1 family non-canonical purine NTP pyrophosphatase [Blastocatellia bacterium]
MRVLLATTNKGKLAELSRILRAQGIDVIGLGDRVSTEEIETAATFAENALLKARHYHRLRGLPTVADDSGLEVEALGGAPGVFSARFAGQCASDAERIRKLLDEMRDLPEERRQARFVCAAAIAWEGGDQIFLGEAHGVILKEARGANGFGYDPVFFYEPLGKTFAELGASEKAEVSHRGLAFRRLAAWLNESGVLDTARSSDKIESSTD